MIHQASVTLTDQDITRKPRLSMQNSQWYIARWIQQWGGGFSAGTERSLAQHFKTNVNSSSYHQGKGKKKNHTVLLVTLKSLWQNLSWPIRKFLSKLEQRNILKLKRLMHKPPKLNSVLDREKIAICLLKQKQGYSVSLLHFSSTPKILASAVREWEKKIKR